MDDVTKQALEEIKGSFAEAVKKFEDGAITETKLNKILTEKFADYAKVSDVSDINKLNEALENMGLELKSIKEKGSDAPVYKSFAQQITEQIGTKSLNQLAKEQHSFEIDLTSVGMAMKAVGTIGITSGNLLPSAWDMTWGYAPLNPSVVRTYSDVSTTTLPVISYIDMGTREGGPGITTSGSAKSQADATPTPIQVLPEKVTVYWDFVEEAMDDIPGFIAEMQKELMSQIAYYEDLAFISAGTNLAQLDGMPAYSATGIETTSPTTIDAIRAAVGQIQTYNFAANVVMMNPKDVANLDITKASGVYVIPPFASQDRMNIAGVRVVPNNNIPVGYLLCGDFTRYHIRDYKSFMVKMGYSGTNFKANILTAIGEKRLFSYVKPSEQNAFVYDAISDIITAITAS